MSNKITRMEVLDLLARGKIGIDEAVAMLDRAALDEGIEPIDEPLYRAELDQEGSSEDMAAIKLAETRNFESIPEATKPSPAAKPSDSGARWLRVQVSNSETGNSKVMVNVPLAMVKFGLSMAKIFSPEMKDVSLDAVDEIFNEAESGLLVDVQDDESKEHVRVFFE